jgi:hypothetical protein
MQLVSIYRCYRNALAISTVLGGCYRCWRLIVGFLFYRLKLKDFQKFDSAATGE